MDTIASSWPPLSSSFPLPPIRKVTPPLPFPSIPSSAKLLLSKNPRRRLLSPNRRVSVLRNLTVTCVGGITEIKESEFSSKVLESDRPVLVEFVAGWCGPCRLITPAMEWVAQEYSERLTVVKIDHDANPRLIEEYKVYGLPTLILFKNGQEVPESRREGAITKVKLKEYVDGLLESISVA